MAVDNAPIMQKLCHLFQDITMISENAIYYYKAHVQYWVKCIRLVRPLFEELRETSGSLNDEQVSALHTIVALCLKMKELLEKCAGKTSKSLPVLLKQSILKAFADLSMDLLSSLKVFPLRTLHGSDHAQEQVEQSWNQLETPKFFVDSLEEDLHEQIQNVLMEIKKGVKLNHCMLADIARKLDLKSNQEILREASLLEKEKNKAQSNTAEVEELIDLLIIMVTQMADDLAEQKQLLECQHGIAIPAGFRCPLSLELMTDPVIVTSGVTYERVYIQQWFDEGNTSCPKSRQQLDHMILIPNNNVKHLITSWYESNDVSPNLEKLTSGIINCETSELEISLDALSSSDGNSTESQITQDEDSRTREDGDFLSCGHFSVPGAVGSSSMHTIDALNGASLDDSFGALSLRSDVSGNGCLVSSSHAVYSKECKSVDYCGSVLSEGITCSNFSTMESVGPLEPYLAGDDNTFPLQVQALVRDLQSPLADAQSFAVKELRLLTKHNMEERIMITKCGAIPHLVSLLRSADPEIQENAVTALLNLSLNDNNKPEISATNPTNSLVHVLAVGTSVARENAAATLSSLSAMDYEKKIMIGQSEAIPLLIDLLINGSLQGKKDAVIALLCLSKEPGNMRKIVRSNAVESLVALMCDPATGLVDKAVAVIHSLTHIPEGVLSIGEAHGGIAGLVEVVETGTKRSKENAAAALLCMCLHAEKFRIAVLQEGGIPPLAALARSGTPKAKEKAIKLLQLLRGQRQGRQGRLCI